LKEFVNAVRVIYASAMSENALTYRAKREVLDLDEQMALLVQRVSGAPYGDLFFPQLAGVGFSFNPYVWDKSIDPESGMLRLVFGLGTRAVNRSDDDYTCVVGLNAPDKHPQANRDQMARYAQRRVDVLDLNENRFKSDYFVDIVQQAQKLPVQMFAFCDKQQNRQIQNNKTNGIQPWVLNFDKIFSKTNFIEDMREMLGILKKAYGCHVDIEFTANFSDDGSYKINLLQCRALQIKQSDVVIEPVGHIDKKDTILRSYGGIIGRSRTLTIDRLIYVVPSVYGHLPERDRYAIARIIGKLTHLKEPNHAKTIMLLGPGRWGTSTPALGVPISFSEINTVSVICEIDVMHETLTPDLSLGTHFFNDLVEMDMLYMGFFAAKKDNFINEEFLKQSTNHLSQYLPEASAWTEVIRVIDASEQKIVLNTDAIKQKAIIYKSL
jgi:hypothetical protein